MFNQELGLGLQVIVNGKPLKEYTKDGKTYVAAPEDQDFQLRYLVPTQTRPDGLPVRFQFITTVDGLGVVDRKWRHSSSLGHNMTPPSSPTANDIKGYRLNADQVALFHFTAADKCYAATQGETKNIGNIDAIVYSEDDPSDDLGSRSCDGDLGTAMGTVVQDKAKYSRFVKHQQVAQFVIEYASRASLIERGIITPNED